MKKILVICAHPDDETLGLGGTLSLNAEKGHVCNVIFFTDGQFGRNTTKKGIEERKSNAKKACRTLGIDKVEFLNYKDQTLDAIPIVELSCKIENYIKKWKPEIIFTHFEGDINQDHRRLFEATMIATRPTPKSKIKQIICYETPSSTDWGFSQFNPNYFVDITSSINKKISAIKKYGNEIKKFPHPRSIKAIKNRATYWGSSVGLSYAEPFHIIRKIENS